jgi:sulfatase modifying factor 1
MITSWLGMCGMVQAAFVPIGNPGNAADTANGGIYGDVAYTYKISTHEVTVAEMAAATGAGDGDENYWDDGTRTVGPGAPAAYVSLYEAMKYCNFLTSGDVDSGYYSHTGYGVYVANALSHDAYAASNGITYFVPTEDEWYKAAYWTGGGYSPYANGTVHTPVQGGGATGWNYSRVLPNPNRMRDTALGTIEQNGTVNMMGNIREWVEEPILRGGSFNYSEFYLRSWSRFEYFAATENADAGFRPVVVIPETFVPIGDIENADDNTTGYGGVAFEYMISDHEVTIAEFAVSGAGDGNEGYWNDGTRNVGLNAPVVYVTLYEAMKYCNYLTSGNVDNGVYVFSGGVYQSTDRKAALFAYDTVYALPTEDEWYKAAYWTGSDYSLYADGTSDTNNPPTEGGGASGWNYHDVNAAPNYTRGGTLGTAEQNGTVNMMGNVDEWMEDSAGVVRGGSYYNENGSLSSLVRASANPSSGSSDIGFRPVKIFPAPPTFVTIGDAGNSADTANGGIYGDVAYTYKIRDREVTIAEFVASNAGDGDENYWNDGTRTVGTDAPAVNVTLYEAMKHCNWLTTGDTNSGYYSSSDGGTTYQANALTHDAYAAAHGITYFVPTEDEWYKAAFWTGNGYSLYANGDVVADGPPTAGSGTTGWNYLDGTTRDTAYGTTEQNGTVNMMGNVWEWMEYSAGVIRGGSCIVTHEYYIRSSVRYPSYSPLDEYTDFGFRPVVVIPEMATAPSLVMSGLNVSWQSETDQDYRVLTTTNLVTESWAPVVPSWTNSGTGSILIYTNTYPKDCHFFKVGTWYQ